MDKIDRNWKGSPPLPSRSALVTILSQREAKKARLLDSGRGWEFQDIVIFPAVWARFYQQGCTHKWRASRSQCEGREFDPPRLHQFFLW